MIYLMVCHGEPWTQIKGVGPCKKCMGPTPFVYVTHHGAP